MSTYDKPVWKLMFDMVANLGLGKADIITRRQVVAWFAEHYPRIKASTVSAHLIRLSTNAPSRVHYRAKPGDNDLFFQIDRNHFRLYDPETDPPPIYRHSKRGSSLMDDVLRVMERYEEDWQHRLQDSEKRIGALEQENEGLRKELDSRMVPFDEIGDGVLKDRLSRLDSPPLDTLIREAGVILEDRLRVVGRADSTLHGSNLVDAVLSPEKGTLIVSAHPGEQDGVRMLYRGAMQFVRNPPMHKLIEYRESVAQLFIRLIDSLLQLLSELEPRQRGQVTIDDVRRMLTRLPVSRGQQVLYEALYQAGKRGLSQSELVAATGRTRAQVSGVLGALGHRINGTDGMEGKGGIEAILDASITDDGDWHYRMRPILREALELEGMIRREQK